MTLSEHIFSHAEHLGLDGWGEHGDYRVHQHWGGTHLVRSEYEAWPGGMPEIPPIPGIPPSEIPLVVMVNLGNDDWPLWVDPTRVEAVSRKNDEYARIVTDSGYVFDVRTPIPTIIERLKEARLG